MPPPPHEDCTVGPDFVPLFSRPVSNFRCHDNNSRGRDIERQGQFIFQVGNSLYIFTDFCWDLAGKWGKRKRPEGRTTRLRCKRVRDPPRDKRLTRVHLLVTVMGSMK